MRHIFLRMLSLMLVFCLVLPQLSAGAEETKTVADDHPDVSSTAFAFDLSMDVSGFPESDRKLLQGFADLVNLLSVEGTFQLANDSNGCFDMDGRVTLHGRNKDSVIPIHFFGNKSHWLIESPVLGKDMTVMLNLDGFLEFSMKAFSYLNVPIQNAVLWLVPYTTLRPVKLLERRARGLTKGSGTRSISTKNVIRTAKKLSKSFENNHSVHYWLMALGNETGYDEMLLEDLSDLQTYVETCLGDKGIQVTVTDNEEVWKSGMLTFFTRATNDSSESWTLMLPKTPVGAFHTDASFEKTYEDSLLNCSGRFSIKSMEMGNPIIMTFACEDFPTALPVAAPFSASLNVEGEMRPEEHVTLSGDGDGSGQTRISLSSNGFEFLSATGTMNTAEATFHKHILNKQALKGFNLLSVNDATMKEFLNKVSGPLVHELLPVLIEVPASTYQSLLDFMSSYGILSLLTYGMSGE